MAWRIGVDIGGTFADFCAFDEESGTLHTLKVLTTPQAPGIEIGTGLDLLQERYAVSPQAVASFVHGTTVGINTIIQRRGAKLGLITTRGFEDVLELARLQMPDMYSLFCSRPDQLIPRDRIWGVSERSLADGTVETELDVDEVLAAIAKARAKGCDGVIISFLNAYRNQANEQAAKQIVAADAPDLFVFAAAEVWPVVREYERTSTAILNGYVHPRVAGYLGSLEERLAERGVPAQPMITKSNGGIMSAALGKADCIGMLLSGTASGVMGAAYVAKQAGVGNALTLDIGGTSADVALVIDGAVQFASGEIVGDFPLNIPSVSVTSIGDGGGSIASVDSYCVLKIGPESAGSTPGPACYGRGGKLATLTDAMVVCGFLGHAPLAYNAIGLDKSAAERALAPLAEALGRSLPETADAMIRVSVSNMFVEVNKLIARFGVDPRDFTLLPFGGAGPMLGCLLAGEIGVGRVMIPRRPGVVSALGGLIADVKCDFAASVFASVSPEALPRLQASLAQLRRTAEHWLREQQRYVGEAQITLSADMRYTGQSFEIEVPLEERWLAQGDVAAMAEAFHRRHAAIFEFSDDKAETYIVNLRLVIAGPTLKPHFAELPRSDGRAVAVKQIDAWFDGATHTLPLFEREQLGFSQTFDGPAVIAQEDTTTIVPPGWHGEVDRFGNLHLTLAPAR